MSLSKYKLSAKGIAYLKNAEDDKNPTKGIIITKKGRYDIRTLDDEGAEAIRGTGFVEDVKKASSASSN